MLRVVSWNVEHFKKPELAEAGALDAAAVAEAAARIDRVATFLAERDPDVLALYEVEGKEVFEALVTKMPGYTFHITEGPQVQEILVGARSGLSSFFTQKTEFKSGDALLRPGALLTVTLAGVPYSFLFLHTKSGNDPKGLGLRDDMVTRAFDFKKTLDAAVGGQANYLFLGDLNTMGMEYRFLREHDIPAADERQKIVNMAAGRDMQVLEKDAPATWFNGSTSTIPPSDLDQVVAAEHLSFTDFGGAQVTVLGWPKLATDAEKDTWVHDYSDHGCLYFEIET